LENINGQIRIIIEALSPQVDDGQFYAKMVVGQQVEVACDLFADGHDVINGTLLYRHSSDKKWSNKYLKSYGNDRWGAQFIVEKQGFYHYTIKGWVDHALNWQHELERKVQGGLYVNVELLEGIQYLERLLPKCTAKEKEFVEELKNLFQDEKNYSEAIRLAHSDKLKDLFYKYPKEDYSLTYEKTLEIYVDRKKALFSTWYEIFPRSAAKTVGKHGTFKDCEKLMSRIAEMGFDTLYFPPIHPIGISHRKGKNNVTKAAKGDPGVPWAIGAKEGGHKSILPELGTLEDFKSLINMAKKHGLEIAMDIAFQCSPDHPYVKEHPKWFKWRPDGTVQYAENPPKKYQDILPINFETEDWENLWNELLSVCLYWNDLGIKIFRLDNPHTKPFRFWQWLIAKIKEHDPDVLFLAEAFTRPKIMHQLAKVGFTQSYTYYTWRNNKAELSEYMTELAHGPSSEYFRPNFWPNTPDINPYNLQGGNQTMFLTRYFMAATLSSNYGMYGPVYEYMVHEAYPGKEEYLNSEKYEIKTWDWDQSTKLTVLIKIINRIRKENSALHFTNNIHLCEIDNDQIFAYFKMSEDETNYLLMVVNLDPHNRQSGWLQLPLNLLKVDEGHDLLMRELITQNSYVWNKEWNFIELDPFGLPFHLFKIEK